MWWTTAIRSPTASWIGISIGISACADLGTTAMESIALKSKRIARKKTFATSTPTAFTTRRCVEALACVTRDMKEPAKVVTWRPNANRRRIAVITRCATAEFVTATPDMNATVPTCKLLCDVKTLLNFWIPALDASRWDHATELTARRTLIAASTKGWKSIIASAQKASLAMESLSANRFHHRATSGIIADLTQHARRTTGKIYFSTFNRDLTTALKGFKNRCFNNLTRRQRFPE